MHTIYAFSHIMHTIYVFLRIRDFLKYMIFSKQTIFSHHAYHLRICFVHELQARLDDFHDFFMIFSNTLFSQDKLFSHIMHTICVHELQARLHKALLSTKQDKASCSSSSKPTNSLLSTPNKAVPLAAVNEVLCSVGGHRSLCVCVCECVCVCVCVCTIVETLFTTMPDTMLYYYTIADTLFTTMPDTTLYY